MDKQLACRLSHASNLAYAIPRMGTNFDPYPELNDDLNAVGFNPTGCKFFRPTEMGKYQRLLLRSEHGYMPFVCHI
jgi:hypothetical protein